jgi:hypothetical protein
MSNGHFTFDRERQERMLDRIEEILRIRGAQDGLKSRQDVIFFAVDELWRKVLVSRSADLDRHCVCRTNLK